MQSRCRQFRMRRGPPIRASRYRPKRRLPRRTGLARNHGRQTGKRRSTRSRWTFEGLAARIAGHNLSLRGLEAELDEKGPWDAARLAPMLDRLKILATRHNDLNLFREAVPESKRESLAKLQSPRSAVAQLGARIFEVRGNVTGQNFAGTEAQREAELQRLDELSRALAELAGK